MIRKVAIAVLGLTIRAATTQPLLAQQVSSLFQETKTEHVSLAPGGTIRIENSFGELNIEGWNQPEVEITVIKKLPYDYEASKSAKDLSVVTVTTERKSDKEVWIATNIATHDSLLSSVARTKTEVWVEYQIHAPRDSKLVIRHDHGTVHVNNMAADIDADSGAGDMVVIIPDPESHSIDAKTTVGPIASDFGKTHKKHFVGREMVTGGTTVSSLVRLRMGRGGITLKTLQKEAYTSDQ